MIRNDAAKSRDRGRLEFPYDRYAFACQTDEDRVEDVAPPEILRGPAPADRRPGGVPSEGPRPGSR